MTNLIFMWLFLSSFSKGVELASLKEKPNLSTSAIQELSCSFKAKTDKGKSLDLKTEKFLAQDLKHVDENQRKGIYVNIFDFMGYQFSLNENKKLIIKVEKEETLKKIEKEYSKLPLNLVTKVSFSTKVDNKTVNLKEVSVDCK